MGKKPMNVEWKIAILREVHLNWFRNNFQKKLRGEFPRRTAPSIAETGGKRPFRCLRPLFFRGRVRKGPARFEKRPSTMLGTSREKRDAGRRFFSVPFLWASKEKEQPKNWDDNDF
jgi:hypothetical protein